MSSAHKFKDYIKRDGILKSIGFCSYSEYLQSDLWKKYRIQVFKVRGSKCKLCNNKATEVHHQKYTLKNLKGLNFQGVYPICRDCHIYVEFSAKGDKKPMDKVVGKFDAKVEENSQKIKDAKILKRSLMADVPEVRDDLSYQFSIIRF